MSGRILPFRWFGAKYSHLDDLLPLLPRTHRYVEPFGGSAAVLVNREPSPVETYNDLDGDVVTFFRVLRERREELIEALRLTPFSREELRRAVEEPRPDDELERARRFAVRAFQTTAGLAQTATPGRWAVSTTVSRGDRAQNLNRARNRLDALDDVADRLLDVQIEHRDALDVIAQHDSPDTLFYVDPPYPHDTREATSRAYHPDLELDDDAHRELAATLAAAEADVAVSMYRSEFVDGLYLDAGFDVVEFAEREIRSGSSGATRTEAVFINYDPPAEREERRPASETDLSAFGGAE